MPPAAQTAPLPLYTHPRVSTGGRKIVEGDESGGRDGLAGAMVFQAGFDGEIAAWNRIEGCFENVEVGK